MTILDGQKNHKLRPVFWRSEIKDNENQGEIKENWHKTFGVPNVKTKDTKCTFGVAIIISP